MTLRKRIISATIAALRPPSDGGSQSPQISPQFNIRLMANRKSLELTGRRHPVDRPLTDQCAEFLVDGIEQSLQFAWLAFSDHPHTAIGQVLHKPGHLEVTSEHGRRMAKAHALNLARIVDVDTLDCCHDDISDGFR